MKKKATIETSMGTIVIIILAFATLIIGIVAVNRHFDRLDFVTDTDCPELGFKFGVTNYSIDGGVLSVNVLVLDDRFSEEQNTYSMVGYQYFADNPKIDTEEILFGAPTSLYTTDSVFFNITFDGNFVPEGLFAIKFQTDDAKCEKDYIINYREVLSDD